MNEERTRYLLRRYVTDKATRAEVGELFALLQQAESDEVLKDFIIGTAGEESELSFTEQDWDRMWEEIKSSAFHKPAARLKLMIWTEIAAACLLLIVGVAVFFSLKQKNLIPAATAHSKKMVKNDVPPGGNRAMLTLADGSVIVLDSAHNGSLAQQGYTKIIKTDAGSLFYKTDNPGGQVVYNTITTPRGGQYQVMLADGTKVWLNAASSLRFPTVFAGSERDVELTGEAYFEVAKKIAMPFHVRVNNMEVRVLGTHFNIMAYGNEHAIATTLLEGRVKVSGNGITTDILPGQQALLYNNASKIAVKEVNTEFAVAWKDGFFRFKETNIKELMRQVERWYDVDVEFKTEGGYQDYTGIVPRSQNVSALLQTLELTGTVHFKVEGRKIIVLP
jgi:ferric-dicitrate binding protein FerR (iron transport regulator)